MKLPYIFSSDALFQADSTFTIRGISEKAVSAQITDKSGKVFSRASAEVGADGSFELTLATPAASFDEYTVKIVGDEEKLMERVLFGEVWLASGQSNMELPNWSIPEHTAFYEKLQGKKLRFFHVDYQGLCDPEMKSPFPYEPQPFGVGVWVLPDMLRPMDSVSALATRFANQIYDYLNAGRDIPVGILDASWGGTPISAWFDKKDIDADERFADRLRELGKYPDAESWNRKTDGSVNFQQTTAQYNVKIAPVVGAKARGIIWYQGENECGGEYVIRSYAEFLRFYHRTYTEKFACDKANFPMISSLLHYWTYGPDGECNMGYSNEAFIETALESPDKFMYAANGDLQPVWSQHQCNHPIHPAHKYQLADRFAKLAIANVYGGAGQKAPATLDRVKVCRGSLKLYFKNARYGLRIGNGEYFAPAGDGFRPVHTLYIAGKDHRYLPAEARIIRKNLLEVRCDGIKSPKYVAYNMQSMEPFADLYCGEFPVTQFRNDEVRWLNIQARPWYDMNNTVWWADRLTDAPEYDLFNRPVWYASQGCEVCADSSFRFETDKSLRIAADGEENTSEAPVISAHVRSYPYARLTFDGYSKLTLNAFNIGKFDAELVLTDGDGEHSFKLVNDGEIIEGCGWYRMSANIKKAPKEAKRMAFRFTAKENVAVYRFVNIERVRLVP